MRRQPKIRLGLLKGGEIGQRLGSSAGDARKLVGTVAYREHVEIQPPESRRPGKSICIQGHSFSARGLSRPKARDDFGQSTTFAKIGLERELLFGQYRSCNTHDISRLAGTPARPSRSGFVFLGSSTPHW